MYSSEEIKNVKFAKSMSGYKQEEVDIFLDKIEADYTQFYRLMNDYQAKIEDLNRQIEEYKSAQNSIQNVLLSAQQLADKIVNEAKEKSEEIVRNAESNISVITAKEKELSTTFELKAQDRKNQLEKELEEMVRKAQLKADAISKAAEDSVERQQVLFDKLKIEIAAFKASVNTKYREHLEILATIPDSVPSDPKRIAEIVSLAIEKEPDVNSFISSNSAQPVLNEEINSEFKEDEEFVEESKGFTVEELISNSDE